MALAKPYTVVDAAKQSEDIDRMLDELYQAVQESATSGSAGVQGVQGAAGVGIPGNDGNDGERGIAGPIGPIGPTGSVGLGIPGIDGEDGEAAQWIPISVSFANPSATIGLAAVNGTATTAIRSDGAPALSQAIAPTWSAAHTFSEIIASAKGISFPAVQVADTGVNVLDDFEEGTWSPTITGSGGGSGQTYVRQLGRYAKVGRLVNAFCYVVLTAAGTVTGSLRIGGLPFTSDATANVYSTATVGYWTGLATAFVCLGGFVEVNTTQIEINGATGATTDLKVALVQADIGNTSGFMARVAYLATA